MDSYYIGTAREYIAVQYGKTEKSICRGCDVAINKYELKIRFLVDNYQNDEAFWFHLNCFHFFRRHKIIKDN